MISRKLLANLDIKADDKVEIKQNGDTFTISQIKSNELEVLLSQWDGIYDEKELDWGDPQGCEIW